MPKTVTVTMRQDQAIEWAKWLGQQRVAELPNEICQSIYQVCKKLPDGNVDVSGTDFALAAREGIKL